MNLTATYNLPQVKDVMLRSELEAVVKNQMDQKNNFNSKMQSIIKQEEIDKILSRSKSVSFNDLVEIRHVPRIILAAVCLNGNYLLSSQMRKLAYKDWSPGDKQPFYQYFLNMDFLGGLVLILIAWITDT